jgi:hypothetical protein
MDLDETKYLEMAKKKKPEKHLILEKSLEKNLFHPSNNPEVLGIEKNHNKIRPKETYDNSPML